MKRLPLLRVVALNVIAGSIDLVLAVEGAYFLPAILSIGVSPFYGAMLLSISPLTSIIIQGCLGSMSDQCQCRWGRRRPFMVTFTVACLFGLMLFPFVEDIADLVSDESSRDAALIPLVIIATFVTDFFGLGSLQVAYRAYTLDVIPQKQIVLGNVINSICLSVGAATGFGIGAVNWSTLFTSMDNFSLQVKFVFGLTIIVTVICTIITLFSVPEQDSRYQEDTIFKVELSVINPMEANGDVNDVENTVASTADIDKSIKLACVSVQEQDPSHQEQLDKSSKLAFGNGHVSQGDDSSFVNEPDQNGVDSASTRQHNCIYSLVNSLLGNLRFIHLMSSSMVILCAANFFGLLALFSQVFFFTNYIGEITFNGDVSAPENSTEYHNYTDGVKFGSLILGVSAIVGLVVSLLLGPLIKLVGMRPLFVTAYVLLMIQSGILTLSPNRVVVFVISPAIAVMNAVMLTFPFILTSKYEAKKFLLRKIWPYADTVILGRACAVLKCSTYVAQVLALAINGPLSDVYGSAVSVMIFTCAISFIGAIVVCFVTVPPTSWSSKKKQKRLAAQGANKGTSCTSSDTPDDTM
ncbi:membrane-associated transporter protein-like [Dysidea avara]|uniref:membrane-associated transporter protein-like n=1 Tax=Dysidea avara TaxID=196820 RepID=UPI0033218FD7